MGDILKHADRTNIEKKKKVISNLFFFQIISNLDNSNRGFMQHDIFSLLLFARTYPLSKLQSRKQTTSLIEPQIHLELKI